jgi:outer membrane protein assembly factor BamB
MKNHKSKNFSTFTATVILIFALMLPNIFTVVAHTPSWSVPTYAYLSVAPNPVGVNQQVAIMMWIDKTAPTAAGIGGDRWQGYRIEITAPDGTKETKGPFTAYAESSYAILYTPTKTGTYTFTFTFPGQVAAANNPINGLPGTPSDSVNDTYLPSSATATLTVQQDQLAAVPDYALPTGYWTRPIEGQNTNWASIASNYLGMPQIYQGIVQPDGSAPNSAHIMWTKQLMFGGVVGGTNTAAYGATYYTGLSYEGQYTNPLIIYGRLYYPLPRSDATTGNGYVCVDLQTGEQIYWQNMTNPTFGQLYDYESMNQHGIISNGYLWKSVTDSANGGVVLMAFDPMDGKWLFNETNVPQSVNPPMFVGTTAGNIIYGPQGEILIYQLNVANKWLACWNNTAAPGLAGAIGTSSDAYQWRPVGKNVNASTAYSMNITIPTLPTGTSIWAVFYGDIVLCSNAGFGGTNVGTAYAISLKAATLGQLLWTTNLTAPAGITRSIGPVDPQTRVLTVMDKETMQFSGYSLDSGQRLWGPIGNEAGLNYFGALGSTPSGTIGYVAYGKLYTSGYGGVVYCIDLKTGNMAWTYGNGGTGNSTNSGLDTPWGNYPTFLAAIADGKVYLYNGEHSPNSPYYKGEHITCIDAYTGKELWKLLSWGGVGGFAQQPWPIADGYMVYLNNYDGQLYCIGKGPSKTTVEAPMSSVTAGSVITVKGTVTDQSAGAKDTPCISDADMGSWMEYLYMQKPMPSNVVGVPVFLTATASDGTIYTIGTATSGIGGSYGISWTAPAEGTYEIIANFTGTNSYGGSYAETYLAVGSASASATQTPTATQTPSQTQTPAPTTTVSASPTVAPTPGTGVSTETLLIAGAAVVIIIAVVAAALVLRKRK